MGNNFNYKEGDNFKYKDSNNVHKIELIGNEFVQIIESNGDSWHLPKKCGKRC